MMKRGIFLIQASLVLSLVGCAGSGKKVEVSSDGYKKMSSGSFALRPFKEVTLENGLKVIFINDSSLPRVSLTLLVKSGVLQDPKGLEGLNALTSYLLEQGTQTKNAEQIADAFGSLGTEMNITPGADFTLLFSDSLSANKNDLLKLFSEIAMNPSFTDVELNRMRSQMIAGLQKKNDNPSQFADDKADELVFGKHPYSKDTNGTIESLKKMTKQDLIRHYLTFFRPNNSSLAVVGNFDAQFEKDISETFAKWNRKNIPSVSFDKLENLEANKTTTIKKKGLQQAQIRLSQVGIKRNDPDFIKLRVANEILGGSFASRLNQKVRDDLGLTYSIYSMFDTRLDAGAFQISTFTKNGSVQTTLDETLKVVSDFVDNGATEKELSAAKNQLVGQFPRAIETADKMAFNLLALDFYGIPASYLTDYNETVQKISLSEINDVIKRRISKDKFHILIYSN